jgi:hypothetical protein
MQKDSFRKDTVIKKGPPKCLSGPEIAKNLSKLVLNREGNGYEEYGEEHNWTHICALRELPYAHALILMHNIDVMHQERNVAESNVSTCLDIMGKPEDYFKAQSDIAYICLEVKDKKAVMRWMKRLKFPNSYAAGVKRCVNVMAGKIMG